MKPKQVLLVLSVAIAFLIAAFLAGNRAFATEPSREIGPSAAVPKVEAWASPWLDLSPSETRTLVHDLGGDWEDYALQLWFRDTAADGYGINNRHYGSVEDNGVWSGVFWRSLTDTEITVGRQPADTVADQVRVWIWPSETEVQTCTGWLPIAPASTLAFQHNMGGDVDDYVIKLWFRDIGSPVGVHLIYYGGAEGGGHLYGAYWHGLTNTQVEVTRYSDDITADEILLCVSLPDPPDWDSDWRDVSQDEVVTLNHGLGGNVNRYIVRTEFKSVPAAGALEAPMEIHQFAYGGDASNVLGKDAQYLGANWQNLTNESIDVYRWADDPYADQIRVRIWLRRMSVYVPIVFK